MMRFIWYVQMIRNELDMYQQGLQTLSKLIDIWSHRTALHKLHVDVDVNV